MKLYQYGGTATQMPDWTPTPMLPNTGEDSYMPYPGMEDESKKQQAPKAEDLLPKELLKKFVSEGLPNDVDATLKYLNSILNAYTVNTSLNPVDMNNSYINMLSLVNKTIHNKEKWLSISKSMEENNSFGEIAITTSGHGVAQMQDGSITLVSPTDISKNNGKFRLLTNSELMQLRARKDSLAFEYNLFDTLDSNVSPDKLRTWLFGYLDKAGKQTYERDGDMAILRGDKLNIQNISSITSLLQDKEVIQETIQLLDPNNPKMSMYSVDRKYSSKAKQLSDIMQSVVALMPQNYRNYLQLKAASVGMDPSNGSSSILLSILSGMDVTENSVKFSTIKQSEKANGSSGSTSKEKLTNANPVMLELTADKKPIEISIGKDDIKIFATGINTEGFFKRDMTRTSGRTWNDVVQNSHISSFAKMTEGFVFSGKADEPTTIDIKDIDSDVQFASDEYALVNLPVNANGKVDWNKIKPTTEVVKHFEKNKKKYQYYDQNGTIRLKPEGDRYVENVLKKYPYLVFDENTMHFTYANTAMKKFLVANINVGVNTGGFWKSDSKKTLSNDIDYFGHESKEYTTKDSRKRFARELGYTEKDGEVYDKIISTVVYIPVDENDIQNRTPYFFNADIPQVPTQTQQDLERSRLMRKEQEAAHPDRRIQIIGDKSSDLNDE